MPHKNFFLPICTSMVMLGMISLLTLAQAAKAQAPSSQLPMEIKKVEYKEMKAGKHNIIINWDLSAGASDFRITRMNIEVELTDAKGEKRKATRTLTLQQPASGKVSITPIPIPKDPIVAIPISDIFRNPRGLEGGGGLGIDGLKFKVKLTATALTQTGLSRTITAVASKEGSLKVKL